MESEVLDDDYKYEVFEAFLEVRDYDEFEELVRNHGSDWDMDINLYKKSISPEIAEHIFERGYSADGGSGLGLAVCKAAVEMHGGTIKLEKVIIKVRFLPLLYR